MSTIGATRSWIRNMMEAGYTDKEIEDIIDRDLIEGVILLEKQLTQDKRILNTMIKERNNYD